VRDVVGADDVELLVELDSNPGRTLVRAASAASLIVLGAGQHPLVARLVGSTVEHAIRHASCPVVVVGGAARRYRSDARAATERPLATSPS
jgi:nucleotide-binding universal stress UspA family protein